MKRIITIISVALLISAHAAVQLAYAEKEKMKSDAAPTTATTPSAPASAKEKADTAVSPEQKPVSSAGKGEGVTLEQSGNKLPANLPRFNLSQKTNPIESIEYFMLRYVVNPVFLLSGGIAVLMIIYSAGRIIGARGEEEGLTAAKTTLTWAAAGLALIMVAFTLVQNLIALLGRV